MTSQQNNQAGDRPLHVLQVTGVMNRGGAEIMLMDILRNLPKDVHFDFLIQTAGKGERFKGVFDDEILSYGCRIFYICPQWTGGGLGYLSEFKKLVRNKIGQPDVVHSHLCQKGGMVALAAHQNNIKKIIVHTHGVIPYRLCDISPRGIELKIQKFLISRYATDFWSCSDGKAIELFPRRTLREHQYRVIKNAINLNAFSDFSSEQIHRFRKNIGVSDDTLFLGNSGRINPAKNLLMAVEVIRQLKRRNLQVKFAFMGRIDDQEYFKCIQNKIVEYHLQDEIVYLGDRDDIPLVMNALDLFLAPSIREGFGMVVIEAQAAGLPCVVSSGHPKDVNMGLGLVHFMDDYNPESWADMVIERKAEKLVDLNKIRTAFVSNGFDAAENSKKIVDLYRS